MRRSTGFLILFVVAAVAIVGLSILFRSLGIDLTPGPDAIHIHIIYAPELELYMPQVIDDFNETYAEGRNPVTGEPLAADERPIFVTGEPGSSGTIMRGIVEQMRGVDVFDTPPTIFAPSVSHWLVLTNNLTRREVFDIENSRGTALAPVVIAIWESRLEAIRNTVGRQDIGWSDLLDVLQSPNGWADYGIEGRRTVYYGHTNPFVSSTGLSTIISEYYASANAIGLDVPVLTLDTVRNTEVRDGVRSIEGLIRHYSERTTEFKEYIAQGPDYLDFVALEENDLIFINRGFTIYQPPERLVALYPREGTFMHEHPFGIVNAEWTTQEQRDAAEVFTDYVLTPTVQRLVMSHGFRPANPEVPIGFPFEATYGVTAEGPQTLLRVPDAETILAIQDSWSVVKKQADIYLVIDVSGSMVNEGRLEQAQQAAIAFVERMDSTNRVGLIVFSADVRVVVPLGPLEGNRETLISAIQNLRPETETQLYGAIVRVVNLLNQEQDENRIRAAIILSDGENNSSTSFTLEDAILAINASQDTLNPVIVIPVAYGTLDLNLLNVLDRIAAASNTTRQSGDPSNIESLLQLISSFF